MGLAFSLVVKSAGSHMVNCYLNPGPSSLEKHVWGVCVHLKFWLDGETEKGLQHEHAPLGDALSLSLFFFLSVSLVNAHTLWYLKKRKKLIM